MPDLTVTQLPELGVCSTVPQEFVIIETALKVLSFYTCVKFKEWEGREKDYLVIWPVEKPAG